MSDTKTSATHIPFYNSPLPKNGLWCGALELALATEPDRISYHENLFSTDYIREDSVYADFAFLMNDGDEKINEMTRKVKAKLGIESELLNDGIHGADAVAYAALSRAFEYNEPFDVLDQKTFTCSDGTIRDGVRFFGFEGDEDAVARDETGFVRKIKAKPECASNVSLLYYHDEEHHACEVRTKNGDRIFLVKTPVGETPKEMFDDLAEKTVHWTGITSMTALDTFAMPYLDLDISDSFDDLEGASAGSYRYADGIRNILAEQSTKLHIDERGGHVESEADHWVCLGGPRIPEEGRRLVYDRRFAMFLMDGHAPGNKRRWHDGFSVQRPYLALVVNDIDVFQQIRA